MKRAARTLVVRARAEHPRAHMKGYRVEGQEEGAQPEYRMMSGQDSEKTTIKKWNAGGEAISTRESMSLEELCQMGLGRRPKALFSSALCNTSIT